MSCRPSSRAAEPSKSNHQHSPDCAGVTVLEVVTVARDEQLGGWTSKCSLCGTGLRYWWAPDHYELDEFNDPYRVTRVGNTLLVYELARP